LFKKSNKPRHELFWELIQKQFKTLIGPYKLSGIGHGHYFDNCLVILQSPKTMLRFVLDREDVFLEFAASGAPPIFRDRNSKNAWFDASILTAYLHQQDQANFSWFYDYEDLGFDERSKHQLARLFDRVEPVWSDLIGVLQSSGSNELNAFRKSYSETTWRKMGWNTDWSSNRPGKTILGHFPEYIDVFLDHEKNAHFFGVQPEVWIELRSKPELLWPVTQRALELLEERKDDIVLATEVRYPESFFAREVKYLANNRP
jgi:hypothetical protein